MIKVVYSYIDYREERVSVTMIHKSLEDFNRFKKDYKDCKYFKDLRVEVLNNETEENS